MDTTKQPGIRLVEVFVEHAEFKHRADHLSLPPTTPIELATELSLNAGVAADNQHALARLTVSSHNEPPALYSFSITMTALFAVIEGEANMELSGYVNSNAWALMYPFAREAVANLTGRGRFGAIWLNPVNFLASDFKAVRTPAATLSRG